MAFKYSKEVKREKILQFIAEKGIEKETIINHNEFYTYFLDSLSKEEKAHYYGAIKHIPDITKHGGSEYFFGKKKSLRVLIAEGKTPWRINAVVKHGVDKTRLALEAFAKERKKDLTTIINRSEFYEKEFLPSLSKEERKFFHSRLRCIPGCTTSDLLFGKKPSGKYTETETIEKIWSAINGGAHIYDYDSYRRWRGELPEAEKNKLVSNPGFSFSAGDFFARFREGKKFHDVSTHISLIQKYDIQDVEKYREIISEENKKGDKQYHFDPENIFSQKFFLLKEKVSDSPLGEIFIDFLNSQVLLNETITANQSIGEKLEQALLKLGGLETELKRIKAINRSLELEKTKISESIEVWRKVAQANEEKAGRYDEIARRISAKKSA